MSLTPRAYIALCPACKTEREMADPIPVQMPMAGELKKSVKGTCVVCGGPLFLVLSDATSSVV